MKDTVNRALREVSDRVKRHEARMAAERIAAEALDLDALTDKAAYRPDPAVGDHQGHPVDWIQPGDGPRNHERSQ